MPFGIGLTNGKPKTSPRLASHASVQELRPRHRQEMSQQQQQQPAASGSSPASPEFRLVFLGRQALSRPNGTGFGSVQKPLKEIYLSHLITCKDASDRAAERLVGFEGPDMLLKLWDTQSGQQHLESYPLDAVAYLDLVLFHTIKGKKRHFGYFRRHTDSTDVVPDSVLIPLHKKDHKLITKAKHRPMLCLIVRRPYGIQFLECHVYQIDSEQAGLDFIREFDARSRARQDVENHSQFSCAWQQQQQQQQLNKWASQPLLLKSSSPGAAGVTATSAAASDLSEAPRTPPSSTNSSGKTGGNRAGTEARELTQQPPRPAPRSSTAAAAAAAAATAAATAQSGSPEADNDDGPMRRSASGTIFDKYKELQVFNIPEYEYMGFQELQQIRIQQKRQRGESEEASSSNTNISSSNQQNNNKNNNSKNTNPSNGNAFNGNRHGSTSSSGSSGNLTRSGGSRIPVSVQNQRPPRPPQSGFSPLQRQLSAASSAASESGEPRASDETPPPRLPPRNTGGSGSGGIGGGGFGGSAKFPSDGNIKARLVPQQQQPQTGSPQQPGRRGFNYTPGQEVLIEQRQRQQQQQQQQQRSFAIQEEAAPVGGRRGVKSRFELPPTPAEPPDAAKPVARVVPTTRPLPSAIWQQQQQQQKSVSRSNSAAVVQPHRVHHRSGGSGGGGNGGGVSGRADPAQLQQRRLQSVGGSARVAGTSAAASATASPAGGLGSSPDFAAALGYLP